MIVRFKQSLIALVVASLLICGCSGKSAQQKRGEEMNDFITQMAIKSEGDVTKLSTEERRKLDELTKGQSEWILKNHPSSKMGKWLHEQQGQTKGPVAPGT